MGVNLKLPNTPQETFWMVLLAYPFQNFFGEDDDDEFWHTTWHETEEEAHLAAEQSEQDVSVVSAVVGPGEGTTLWAMFDLESGTVGQRYLVLAASQEAAETWVRDDHGLRSDSDTRYSGPIPITVGPGVPIFQRPRRSEKATEKS